MFDEVCTKDPKQLSISSLAYIGDSVFELYTRLYMLENSGKPIQSVHKSTVSVVSAKAQANSFRSMMDTLDEEEIAIYKRGRNSHPKSKSKNANPVDYQTATGFETLIGYLCLSGRKDRMKEIILKMIELSTAKQERNLNE